MNNVLHIYGQAAWHDEVRIAGTRDALESLALVLKEALDKTENPKNHTFFVNDGEGFRVRIVEVNDYSQLAVPYTSEYAEELRETAVWP